MGFITLKCTNDSLSQTIEQIYTKGNIQYENALIRDRCITKTMADCGHTNSNMSITFAHSNFEIIVEAENVLYCLNSKN